MIPAAIRAGWLLLCLIVAACGPAPDRTAAGRHIFRDGILPDGQPLTAFVVGDVPVLGTQFSCQSCHGRSGMGTGEGRYIVPPVAAQFLYREAAQPKRPAYDTASLARVLREGVTPGGRTLDRLMPRYEFSDDEVASLAAYLATLSPGNSPGVDETTLRFAAVVTDDVDPRTRDAVLAVLRQFFDEKNRQTRAEGERFDRGYAPESRLPSQYRAWELVEWTLSGAGDGWQAQLDRKYAEQPVFALVSGLGGATWGPVGRFCERQEIPCLLPGTPFPDALDGDFYTLHFSAGIPLEAGLVAEHLRDAGVGHVVQLACDDIGSRAADALDARLEGLAVSSQRIVFDCASAPPETELAAAAGDAGTAVVLWLRPEPLARVARTLPAARLYLSATLLGADLSAAVADLPGAAFVAHPYRLPGAPDPAMLRFTVWAKTRGIDVVEPRLQAEAFFACLAVNDAILHMGRFFVRDYMLDMLDHTQSLVAYLPYYPRPTLGPGQRYLSKGGYVLPIVNGAPDPAAAAWLSP